MKSKKVFLLLLLLAVFIGSLMIGQRMLSMTDLLAIAKGEASRAVQLTFWNFRLPRSLVALFGGAGLALSGYLLQGLTKNPLADAGVLGINGGAGLLVMLYLGFFANGSVFLLPVTAAVGGLLCAALVYGIAFSAGRFGLSMNKLLLSGIAVNAGVSALTLLVTIKLSKESYQFVTGWLAGSIWGVTWQHALLLIVWIAALSLVGWFRQPILNLLALGRESALSLGVKVNKEQSLLLVIATLLASVSVAFCGSLAFLGLLAPHIAKTLTGRQGTQSYWLSAVCGGIILLVADTLGRLLMVSGEVPAGILIALIGAPYFLYLMLKRKL
ncbi:FecCD family ABC transporter permease [Enterococcus sp. CU9D]|uniref:FecCD family ABC transporter permease n=1 Tax=Candidatus Enterococcus leclercqii TaxID=1857218 RepID=UPI00137A5A3D|nr:iron ABC transporter permease [Enterococcus sp. CU9D]